MWVMAVGAAHGALINSMFVWHLELRANIGVAGVTQLRLGLGEQLSGRGRLMNGMAFGTDDAVVDVSRSLDVESGRVAGVASQTNVHSLLRFQS